MDSNTFDLNREFVRELAEMYHNEQGMLQEANKEMGYKPTKLLPMRRIQNHIKQLIEVSFWASVKKEEGRHHTFALNYAAPEPNIADNDFVVFNPRLAFSAEILSKVAPAVESTKTIGVWPKTRRDREDKLEIWGFVPFLRWPLLLVNAIEPGQIILSISGLWKAKITEKSQIVDVGKYDNLFSNVYPAYPTEGDSQIEAEKIVKAERMPDLEKIAIAMRAHGHGGTLLIIPNDNTTCHKSIDMGSFRFKPYEKFKKDLERRDAAVRQFALGSMARDFHSSYEDMAKSIKSIAQFTAVDGATLITPDRILLGFGAKIKPVRKVPDENYNLVISNPFYKSEPEHKNLMEMPWGTRHRSAARFVFDQKGTVAIVASADGRLSIFKRDGRNIFVLQHAEFMWL